MNHSGLRRAACLLGALLCLAGCAAPAIEMPELKMPSMPWPSSPALLDPPSAEQRIEIAGTLSRLLNGSTVQLPDDTFAASAELTVLPPAQGTPGKSATARDLTKPVKFRLLAQRGKCLIEQVEGGKREPLPNVKCKAAK
jgi:hypothetical protein